MSKLHLYWWSKKGDKENYGDILGYYLVDKLSQKKIVRVIQPRGGRWYKWIKKHYVTVGSIISVVSRRSVVWGSGIIKENAIVDKAKFLAVRGPRTRKRLLELGYKVPEIYGDPALLLPLLIPNTLAKKYTLGIIPHYVDYDEISNVFSSREDIKVIDLLTNDVEKTTKEIMECETIISSSLHGVIVSHAYQIPAVWIKFSDKLSGDNVKFYDYYESVGIQYNKQFHYNPATDAISKLIDSLEEARKLALLLPEREVIEKLQKGLLKSCPFLKKGVVK